MSYKKTSPEWLIRLLWFTHNKTAKVSGKRPEQFLCERPNGVLHIPTKADVRLRELPRIYPLRSNLPEES